MNIAMDRSELKSLIKEALKEVIDDEKNDFFLRSLPVVNEDEMKDIEEKYGKPGKKDTAYSEKIEI